MSTIENPWVEFDDCVGSLVANREGLLVLQSAIDQTLAGTSETVTIGQEDVAVSRIQLGEKPSDEFTSESKGGLVPVVVFILILFSFIAFALFGFITAIQHLIH